MTPPTPRPADPARDNAGLCDLARRCPQGRQFRFYHHRDDYWERARLQPDSRVLIIDVGGRPAAAVTFARKSVRLAGAERAAVYVFDLMVDPEQRGRGLARRLLAAVREANPGAGLFYSYIVEDNLPSRRLFEGDGFRPYPHRLLYHPVLPLLERRRPPTGFRRSRSAEEAAEIDEVLRRRCDFLDTTAGNDGLFILERGGFRAWAALRRHEPQVFVAMPWYGSLVGRLLPIVPRPGNPVTVWSLHHLGAEVLGTRYSVLSTQYSVLRRLIRSVTWLASKDAADALVLPLFENDPLTAAVRPLTLTRWGVSPGVAILHAAGDVAPLLFRLPRPFLLSGRDA